MIPVRTTCPYCGVGCGVLATEGPDGRITLGGDPDHPANFGRLCAKGAALADTIGLDDRLLHPRVNGRRVSWEAALEHVAGRLGAVIRAHGPDAVAFYVSGQLLTEDYYVANKLMKGFIGSANIDTNSRLCMASAVAAHKRAFGADVVPCSYDDLEQADLVVLVGSNAAWCHPVLHQRLTAVKERRPKLNVVTIDPRRTTTAELADLHLSIRSGTDALLFAGLLVDLVRRGVIDRHFVETSTEGLEPALATAEAEAGSLAAVAAGCGLAVADVERFFALFAARKRTVTLFSQGVNQSAAGTDTGNAIINVHLLTGRIGRLGVGPFSITGQPNAMGGREVGALANQLACHVDFADPAAIQRIAAFWQAPAIARRPGLMAIDLFRAIEDGRIKALWVMATNPAVSLPEADRVRRALAGLELLVVSDCVARTDTTAAAHVLLPAAAWGEKDGTATNSERRISRQRAFRKPPGEARPDWWIVAEVARRLGHGEAFAHAGPAAIFREHAALSRAAGRDFDLGALATLSDAEYGEMVPTVWPLERQRPFADGRFHTPTGRARFVAVGPKRSGSGTDPNFPLLLNTGRYRDQWHTMSRTGGIARLAAHRPEPLLELHPSDAARCGIKDGALVRVESRRAHVVLRAHLTTAQAPGTVFAPIHWSGRFASAARVGALIAACTDPVSGQPELKATPVRLRPFEPAWRGFCLSRREPCRDGLAYWVTSRVGGGFRLEMAGNGAPRAWLRLLRAKVAPQGEWLDFADHGAGQHRTALIEDARLSACAFIARVPEQLPDRAWLADLMLRPHTEWERATLLAGCPGGENPGPLVCTCHSLARRRLLEVVRDRRLGSVEELRAATGAGSTCGSCAAELASLIADASDPQAPA